MEMPVQQRFFAGITVKHPALPVIWSSQDCYRSTHLANCDTVINRFMY